MSAAAFVLVHWFPAVHHIEQRIPAHIATPSGTARAKAVRPVRFPNLLGRLQPAPGPLRRTPRGVNQPSTWRCHCQAVTSVVAPTDGERPEGSPSPPAGETARPRRRRARDPPSREQPIDSAADRSSRTLESRDRRRCHEDPRARSRGRRAVQVSAFAEGINRAHIHAARLPRRHSCVHRCADRLSSAAPRRRDERAHEFSTARSADVLHNLAPRNSGVDDRRDE